MTIKTFTAGEKLNAQDLNDNFTILKTIGTGVAKTNGFSTTNTTFTTGQTTDFTASGENKEVYNFNWAIRFYISNPPASRTGSVQFIVTFDDATTDTVTVGSITNASTRYTFQEGYYSGTKKIDTIQWQVKTSNADTPAIIQGVSESNTSYAADLGSAIYFTYMGDY